MEFYHELSEMFWDDDFWLPVNHTWADFEAHTAHNTPHMRYAQFDELATPVFAALGVILIRVAAQSLFRQIGRLIGLKDRKRAMPQPESAILETVFKSSVKVDDDRMESLTSQTGLTSRQVERWLRQRSLVGKSSKLDKFCESAWKGTFYTTMYVYSWVILWDKTHFWHITDCWYKYPNHHLTSDIYYYYMIELAFYWSLLISQFFDVQRSDFKEMFAHHVATILLLSLSYTCNLFRVGTLVLWVHDCADVFLESAKMFKYAGKETVSDLLFYGFAVSWMVTRLGYFPSWILYSITVEAGQFLDYFGAYNVFSLLLSILLILNLFWAYFIFKVAYLAYHAPKGRIEKDLRSEDNSSD